MSTAASDGTIDGHLVSGIGDDYRDRVNDIRSNNNVVEDDEINRLPGNTAT